jgi:hypothetical protein
MPEPALPDPPDRPRHRRHARRRGPGHRRADARGDRRSDAARDRRLARHRAHGHERHALRRGARPHRPARGPAGRAGSGHAGARSRGASAGCSTTGRSSPRSRSRSSAGAGNGLCAALQLPRVDGRGVRRGAPRGVPALRRRSPADRAGHPGSGGHPVTKVVAIGEGEHSLDVLDEARAHFAGRAEVTLSHPRFLEFLAPGVSKGAAIRWLARRLGVPLGQCLAIGDQYNDLEMIGEVGHGVAMPSAPAAVQAAARYRGAAGRRRGGGADDRADRAGRVAGRWGGRAARRRRGAARG